jgi:hypothetical protein
MADKLRKYEPYLYNQKAKSMMLLLDLRIKIICNVYKRAMQEAEDTLNVAEATTNLEDRREFT